MPFVHIVPGVSKQHAIICGGIDLQTSLISGSAGLQPADQRLDLGPRAQGCRVLRGLGDGRPKSSCTSLGAGTNLFTGGDSYYNIIGLMDGV